MAMMMTGRVLLVCALCVLWCGAGGVYARDVDNNALGGCVASEVLSTNWFHLSSGCEETALTPPLRSALPISAVEASTVEEVSSPCDGSCSRSAGDSVTGGGVGGLDGSLGGTGDVSRAGVSVVGSSGPREDCKENRGANLVSSLGGAPPTPISSDDASHSLNGELSTRTECHETVKHSESKKIAESKVKTPEMSTPLKEHHSNTEDTEEKEVADEGPAEGEARQNAVVTKDSSSDVQAPLPLPQIQQSQPPGQETPVVTSLQDAKPPEKQSQATPILSTEEKSPKAAVTAIGEGDPPTTTHDLQSSTEENHKTLQSPATTTSETQGQHLKDGMAEQQGQDATTADLVKNAATGNPAGRTASSISTSGSGESQRKPAKENDDTQRPNRKKPQNGLEDVNTKDAPTATETAPQTAEMVTNTQTNNTATVGDSDGSTAVSHTTSPLLLLLLVACAAAAAVVAA
ncbi:Mucin-associated surface protein (MASP), subgroup S091 [Trypanosoma cruzi]|uniref:Mucin-associated surface protein (MASP), putative n=1 Tax=Trypanosoma cruzi (strain CL Brener) TaxID=353153 RepID=Q4E280_TRYCC|nr:mucin-associated surface protein (MASP), putative [Trypanosoma cruzi]EAN98892.1 mucin-associated surface protein (MASP), putative [Trypanosoma cruzi]KAF8292270.1 Mucin-associated surface protein (MASP), subgroup S091 [Trypanosoma cruzi]|eukprot:XP_820743.1 mucin-associated surface protein (MASP) [Trypanosoma cruzi strain CL Brener]